LHADASGLPADVKAAAAAPTDGAAAAPRGHSPETGLIAVSSSASLASNGGATGGAAASNGAGPGSADGSGGGSEGSGDGGDGNRTLYLGNLHPFVTEATLQEVFAGLAGITELKVIKDKATGVSAGYGFAKFTGGWALGCQRGASWRLPAAGWLWACLLLLMLTH
jgi:hypothetical protein